MNFHLANAEKLGQVVDGAASLSTVLSVDAPLTKNTDSKCMRTLVLAFYNPLYIHIRMYVRI